MALHFRVTVALLLLAGASAEEGSCAPGAPCRRGGDDAYVSLVQVGVANISKRRVTGFHTQKTVAPGLASLAQSLLQHKAKQPSQAEVQGALPEALVKELAYLAGGISGHSVTLMDTLGWQAGTSIVDTQHAEMGFLDTAQVYKKGADCAIVFSATDDPVDNEQQLMGTMHPQEICGMQDVNGGYAQEMKSYISLPTWKLGMQELVGCKNIYSTGHSMGGAMASLFAYCANTKATFPYSASFGGLPEVALVSFGAPAVAKTPLYNGKPGTCFKGTRRFTSLKPALPSKKFQLANLQLFVTLAGALGQEAGVAQLTGAATMLSDLPYPSDQATGLLKQTTEGIGAMWLVALSIMQDQTIPGFEALKPAYPKFQGMIQSFLTESIPDLLYNYDPVPQLFSAWGYKHALVNVEPQQHSHGHGAPQASAECGAASEVPNEDYAQLFWGVLMANAAGSHGLSFPNHGMCCLISDKDCGEKFSVNGWSMTCGTTMFR